MPIPEPNIDPEDLTELRGAIESMHPTRVRFLELRGTALQLIDDLDSAYRRLGVMYERADAATGATRPSADGGERR